MKSENIEKVLELLQQNARLTSEQLSERLMISVEEVNEIIEECEKSNVIRGYYTLVNEDHFDRQRVRAVIDVSVEPERDGGFDRIAKNIARFPEVTDVLLVSGNFDISLIVVGDSLQDVANFVSSKLAPLSGIRSTRTHFMLKKYKEAGFAFEDDEDYERLKITP